MSIDCFAPPDISKWKIRPINGGVIVVTNAGVEKLRADGSVSRLLQDYRQDIRAAYMVPGATRRDVRHHLKAGGNSDVYCVGQSDVVVKEALHTQSVFHAMQRAEQVRCIAARVLPAHVRVPEYYAAVISKKLPRQYLVIQKVNAGTTVEDIKDGTHPFTEWEGQILEDFATTRHTLDKIDGIKSIFTDWHEGNVVVDFDTVSTERPYTLWVLDQ